MASRRGRKTTSRRKSRAPVQRQLEWIGARFLAPLYVMEGGPRRPEMILWLELPTELIVGMHVIDPKEPLSFGEILRHALARPIAGAPRTPDRIRVAEARLAEEAREVVGDAIAVEVAPTPEVDVVVARMQREIPQEREPSYLDGDRLPEEDVRRLFEAAGELYPHAPWERAGDDQVVRVDVPALGVEGACVSIIGALGESFGFVVFPSQIAFEACLEATREGLPEEGPVDLGTAQLALNFEAHRDVPRRMVREVASHGWPLAAPDAYPFPRRIDQDGVLHPMEARDLDVLAATATALAKLFGAHGEEIARGRSVEATASYRGGIEVRARMPYGSAGAGLSAHAAASNAEVDVNPIEGRLAKAMWRFAHERFGKAWRRARRGVKNFDEILPFSIPWSLYRCRIEGRTAADWFFDEYKDRLSESERAWLENQRRSWLGIWEVEDFEPGATLDLRDLLTGERRRVQEKMGSRGVSKRVALLGAVVEHQGAFLMTGTYPHTMPPMEAFRIVEEVCAATGAEPGSVPVEKLREAKIERLLLESWERALGEVERRRSQPLRLANTDGDPLLFTNDRFTFEPGDRPEVEHGLRALGADVEEEERNSTSTCFAVVRCETGRRAALLPSTLLGRIEVGDGSLTIETNSVKRADWIRRRVEEKCGERLRHRIRDHADPVASFGRGAAASPSKSKKPESPPELLAALREQKARFYRAWVDEPIPALDGRTPREASRDAAGRRRVDALIKNMENMESRLPTAEQFDFQPLRRELSFAAESPSRPEE